MLSPGKWHLQVPRTYRANLQFRLKLLRLCRDNPARQAAMIHACKEDILFYVNAFVWQINPRLIKSEIGPFLTWPFQEEAILQTIHRLYEDQDDMLWEKSREMGATWMALIIEDWTCLFHPWKKFLTISHSEQAVDRAGDADSLFWKIRFMHEHLPGWLLRGAAKQKLRFRYPATRSSLTGTATSERSGVGGRATAILLDEFSKHRDDYAILGQTADTGPRLFIGTHYGLEQAFYGLTQRPDMRKIIMHWTQHPEKWKGAYRYDKKANQVEVLDKTYAYPADFNFVLSEEPLGGPFPGIRSPWYDRECRRRNNSRDVAMHLDINPQGSQSQFFDPLTIRILQETYAVPPVWEGDISFDPDSGRPRCLVKLEGGPVKLWILPKSDGSLPQAPYAAGADVSTGNGTTNSVFTAGDARSGEKVLEYATANTKPERFAMACVALCWLLKDESGEPAKFAWEHAGPGLVFGEKVIESGYRNIYYREAHQTLAGGKVSDLPGWYPNNSTKRLLLDEYRAALEARWFLNRSHIALKECLDYRRNPQGHVEHPGDLANKDDPSGARVNHGDRVIGDALCWKMMDSLGYRAEKKKEKVETKPGSLAWRRTLRHNQTIDGWQESGLLTV